MADPNKVEEKLDRRVRGRKRQFRLWRRTGKKGHLKMFRRHKKAIQKLRKIRRKLLRQAPRIVTATQIGINPSAIFGGLGTPLYVTGHYTAGPKDTSDDHAIQLCKSYDAQHRAQGWEGIGYHYCITRAGTIIGLRPVGQKGAHVGGYNTGNVGVMVHGTLGDLPTAAQERSLRWLLDNAHTSRMPAAHRSPRSLANLPRRGHNSWPGHTSNSCPGSFKPMYLRGGSR